MLEKLPKLVLGSLFFGGLLAGGLFGAYQSATQLPMAWSSEGWPTTDGRIVEANFRFRGKESRSRFSILYAYQVGDQYYDGRRIRFMGKVFGDSAREQSNKYHTGAVIAVHYNQADPKRAVLETGVHWFGFAGVAIGSLILILFGVVGFRAMFFKGDN